MPNLIELPPSPAPRVSIVIVTTTNTAGLERCLMSLPAQFSEALSFETIVVLNGAEDDVRRLAIQRVRGAKVVESLVNRGFAGGSNLGRTAASGELLVMLHDDAEPQRDWLAELVRCADEKPEAGAVGGRVCHPDGTLQLAGAVLWRDASTTSLGAGHGDFRERRGVDYAGSASLLVRAATWDAAGGMDDRLYPAYYVDADLAMAIRAGGQSVLYEPRSVILHHRGASSSARMRTFASARNRERFRGKWARELEAQEPPAEGPEALARALRRAHDEAERLRGRPPARPAAIAPRSADSADAERRFLRMDRELRDALEAQLTDEVEALHETIHRKDGALRLQEEALHRLHEQLAG